MSFTIADCINGSAISPSLSAMMDNRQDLVSPADGSLGISSVCTAIQQLTETYEFEELKYQTWVPPLTTLQMTAGNPYYLIATILATIPTNTSFPQFQAETNIVDITDVYTFWMWFNTGVNQAGRALEYRRVTAVDEYSYGITSPTQGQIGVAPPAYFTRFNNYLQVGPAPDQAYDYFVRVKLRHPFPTSSVASQPVFTADSWQQAIQTLACYNVALWEGASQYQTLFANRLMAYGVDVKVLRLKPQMERDEMHNTRMLSLRVGKYTYA